MDITERITKEQLTDTLAVAVYELAQAQGATVTVSEYPEFGVWIELPSGKQYDWGHTGFGMKATGDATVLDVWHDCLVGISYKVIDAEHAPQATVW